MGLIKDKGLDAVLTGGEKLLGTDVDGTTSNYELTSIAAFVQSYIGSVTSGGELNFQYSDNINAGAGSGTFRTNNVDPKSATKLWVATEDSAGIKTLEVLENLDSGSEVLVRQGSEFILYQISSGTDQTTYFELNVVVLDSSVGAFTDATASSFTFFGVGGTTTDNSLSESNQTIADAVVRTINTTNSGYLSFQQDGVEIARLGGNNDEAFYVKALEGLPGGSGYIDLVSPIRNKIVDTGSVAASDYQRSIVSDLNDNLLYYSDGSSWYEITSDKSLSAANQSVSTAVTRYIDLASGASTKFQIKSNGTVVLEALGSQQDRIYIDGLEGKAGSYITQFDPMALPEVDTGAVAASTLPHTLVRDAGTVYYSNATTWNALSPQSTTDLIVKDPSSPQTISNYYFGTQAQIDAISPKDANTWYIPSDGVSAATPKSTASATAIELDRTGGHYVNMASANTATTYTISGTPVLGGWAKIRINASSEPSVTGATKSGGIPFVASTDMYLVIEHNGNRTEYWFTEY